MTRELKVERGVPLEVVGKVLAKESHDERIESQAIPAAASQ